MEQKIFSIRLALGLAASLLSTSCTWSPLFQRHTLVVPTVTQNAEYSASLDHMRSKLENVLDDIAKRHGMKACPSFLTFKREVARFCTPAEGIHYMLIITAIQTNGAFQVKLEEPDRGALFKAEESDRAKIIWNDLLQRLHAEFPGCVREEKHP